MSRPIPDRFFGPVEPKESEEMLDLLFSDYAEKLHHILHRFNIGDKIPQDLSYEIQALLETMHEKIRFPEPQEDGDSERKRALEEAS